MPASWVCVLRFAGKMLWHSPGKTLGSLGGVAFAVCLSLVQIGLRNGSLSSMALVINHSSADLWVVARGSPNFEYTMALPEREAYRVRSIPGVVGVEPVVAATVHWHLPGGGMEAVQVVGVAPEGNMLRPWNVCAGQPGAIQHDRNILVDKADLAKLGCPGVGAETELFFHPADGMQARVVGLTERVRTFINRPIVLTGAKNARAFAQLKEDTFTGLLVRTAPGADRQQVKHAINAGLEPIEAFTRDEFADHTRNYWSRKTSVGVVLLAFAFLGIVIGVGTVTMLQYIATMDHLSIYATLKALGAANRRIVALVVVQALLVGLGGYLLGAGSAFLLGQVCDRLAIMAGVELTPSLYGAVFLGTLVLCAGAAWVPVVKILRTDPEIVFRS